MLDFLNICVIKIWSLSLTLVFPAVLRAAWGAGLRAETPEVHCASTVLIIKYLGSVCLAI